MNYEILSLNLNYKYNMGSPYIKYNFKEKLELVNEIKSIIWIAKDVKDLIKQIEEYKGYEVINIKYKSN